MESSVIKVEGDNINVIRLGSLSVDKISSLLKKEIGKNFNINILQKREKDNKN